MPPRGIHLSARRTAIFVGVLCFSGRLATAADDHDHDHAGHHHHVKCECLANEQGWSIDCTNAVPVTVPSDISIPQPRGDDICAH